MMAIEQLTEALTNERHKLRFQGNSWWSLL